MSKQQRVSGFSFLGPPAVVLVACSSTLPSRELVDAREVYRRAQSSDARTLAPADLHRAGRALDRAERSHAEAPGSFEESSLAYMARREAEIAMAKASQVVARQDIERAERAYANTQTRLREQAQAEAAASESALLEARAELEAAKKRLEGVSRVRSGPRGLVITLEGAVLFASGESSLLPSAEAKLGRVADVLQKQDPKKSILVQGHTDSVGSDEGNLELSEQRAEAVKTFLVARGVPPDRIRSEGKGESQPLTGNDTPEDRANNRRVEIVVLP